ncbi:hypothetical protein Ahy_B02g059001 [Arachis hypogaea]|uniref:Uncharacterized protein n=1 Tax=Arachis hypogaea TaxID=3818 RepID=A0A445AFW6_ARAHY|nr:hypothetical protein Ahy_B02g059001 [Arachis hypogaea]
MGGGSIRAGSSISSPSNGYQTRTQSRSRRFGVSKWCSCGCWPVLRWSGTDSNLNKSFFCRPNYNLEHVICLLDYKQVGRDSVDFLYGRILDRMNQLRNQNIMETIMKALNSGVGMNFMLCIRSGWCILSRLYTRIVFSITLVTIILRLLKLLLRYRSTSFIFLLLISLSSSSSNSIITSSLLLATSLCMSFITTEAANPPPPFSSASILPFIYSFSGRSFAVSEVRIFSYLLHKVAVDLIPIGSPISVFPRTCMVVIKESEDTSNGISLLKALLWNPLEADLVGLFELVDFICFGILGGLDGLGGLDATSGFVWLGLTDFSSVKIHALESNNIFHKTKLTKNGSSILVPSGKISKTQRINLIPKEYWLLDEYAEVFIVLPTLQVIAVLTHITNINR